MKKKNVLSAVIIHPDQKVEQGQVGVNGFTLIGESNENGTPAWPTPRQPRLLLKRKGRKADIMPYTILSTLRLAIPDIPSGMGYSPTEAEIKAGYRENRARVASKIDKGIRNIPVILGYVTMAILAVALLALVVMRNLPEYLEAQQTISNQSSLTPEEQERLRKILEGVESDTE